MQDASWRWRVGVGRAEEGEEEEERRVRREASAEMMLMSLWSTRTVNGGGDTLRTYLLPVLRVKMKMELKVAGSSVMLDMVELQVGKALRSIV